MEDLSKANRFLLTETVTDAYPAVWILNPKQFVQLSQPVPAARCLPS